MIAKQQKQCFFCSQNIQQIDYKDTPLLKRFISGQGKIISRVHTGICATHQRALATAIKRARQMALLSAISK